MNNKFSLDVIKKYITTREQKYKDKIAELESKLEEKQLAKALNENLDQEVLVEKTEEVSFEDLDKIIGGIK